MINRYHRGGSKPKELPEFRWINTLCHIKISLIGAFHAFKISRYAVRYLSTIAYQFNRRFILSALTENLLRACIVMCPRPARI